MRKNVTAVIAALLFVSMLAAQGFQVRTRVDLVEVPVSVRDGQGKLVTGLTQKDFTILEDGVRTIEVKGRSGGWKIMHRKGYTPVP
jgi:hypothetical protein